MDLLQVMGGFETGNGRVNQRFVVDCFVLENSLLVADSSKKKRGIFVKSWVNFLLGFF
jgi:hypothetical protein